MPIPLGNEILQVPDDAWDILRDCRVFFLKQLVRLLQEAERLQEEPLRAFVKGAGAYYDDIVSTEKRSRFDQLGSLTASRISLLGEDDLELDIRLSSFVSQLLEANSNALWHVYLRFVTLLGRPDLSPSDNPVGPKAVAMGLVALCKVLGDDHDRALDRIARLEDHFGEFLPALYLALNDFLVGRKVSAAQPTIVTAPDVGEHAAASGAAGGMPALDAAAALQKSLLGQQLPGRQVAAQAAWSGGAAASLVTQVMFGRLLARLDDLERAGHLSPEQATAAPRPLNAAELGVPSGAPEAAAIDALAMIFEAIFESPELPDAVKSALASLQIPTLKAAMLDSSFFTADAHPARQLLDKMARAAVGLPFDVSSRHPLCASIQQIASRVRAEFVNDTQVFLNHVAELDKLIAERDTATAQVAAAYRPLLQRLEKSDLAESRSREAIDQACMNPNIPADIARFLHQHWQRVLRQVWLEHGDESPEWRENTLVIDNLLWSIRPKVELEERKQLAAVLPRMLQTLSLGMQRIALPEAARGEFLDTCFALQTAAMRGATAPAPAAGESPETLATPQAASVVPVSSELRIGTQLLRIFDLAGSRMTGRYRQALVRTGDWVAFRMADDQPLCGRVCSISKDSGKLLLANPDWDFAVLLHPAIMESQVREGKAGVSSRFSLFNAAAEQALRRTPEAGEVRPG
ncbi:MAG TPA: DUF1631 family protein [Azonexus sp.]|jgi:hypothetical protein|nr:DUF1631 family protein [Azonexus sp.]